MVTLLLADERVDPNIADGDGDTALAFAVDKQDLQLVKLLLAHKLLDPNIANLRGKNALSRGAEEGGSAILELIIADHRTIRTRPPNHHMHARAAYDTALRNVKRSRNARFRGLTRLMVAFRRMRLRAAQTVYAPGGTGFAAAAASFNAAAASAAAGGNGNGNGSS